MANGHAIVRAAKVSGSLWYRSTACPMLGLEIIGRSLRVSALACLEGERLQWEPLTPLLNLLPLLGVQPCAMRTLARTLVAFREAAAELETEQRNATDADPPPSRDVVALPYPLRGGRFVDLTPCPDGSAVAYTGRDGDAPVRIKFAHGPYGREVHAAWAAAGLAPALVSHAPLPGGMSMVMMEELSPQKWRDVLSLPAAVARAAAPRIEAALARAHALPLSGGGLGVHGDLRLPNVMLNVDWREGDADEGVRFVDFDWGRKGRACIPLSSAWTSPGRAAWRQESHLLRRTTCSSCTLRWRS